MDGGRSNQPVKFVMFQSFLGEEFLEFWIDVELAEALGVCLEPREWAGLPVLEEPFVVVVQDHSMVLVT